LRQIPRLTPYPCLCIDATVVGPIRSEISSDWQTLALPDPNVRDRAGRAVVVIDQPVRSHGYGAGGVEIRRRSSRAACRHASGLPDASRDGYLWLRSSFVSGRAG
jgi:hypothetical protein